LLLKGYPSIGCWPCTRPVKPGDGPRSGRWVGQAKTECGLHDEFARDHFDEFDQEGVEGG